MRTIPGKGFATTVDKFAKFFQKPEFPKPGKHTPAEIEVLKTLRDAKERINDKHEDDTLDVWNEK